jgi:cell division control protein 24
VCYNPSTSSGHSTYHHLSFPSSSSSSSSPSFPTYSSPPPPPMSAPSSRKKSIVSSVGPSIDLPVAHNTLLNKSASQSTSLYQQCSSLRTRLLRIKDFQRYFALASPPHLSRQSTDPVTQLWDCFALGVPLCFLFNLLPPPITPINVNTAPDEFDVSNERDKKRAIALFSMQIRQLEDCEQFTVTDLYNRDSTDGFVKVCLPAFFPPTASHRLLPSPRSSTQ